LGTSGRHCVVIDRPAQTLLAPLLTAFVRPLARWGVGADVLTVLGCGLGLAAAMAIVWGQLTLALALIIASRLLDGLDGTLARLTQPTARGAFLDIVLDFVFYAAIPLAFALHDPAANALAAAVLMAAFVLNATSFLAYALLIEKHRLQDEAPARGLRKGFVFLGGLAEAGETLAAFVLMCLWPQHFAAIALGFAALCLVSWAMRLAAGWRRLQGV
jgi:phosphatidylglycerophosphate synthase